MLEDKYTTEEVSYPHMYEDGWLDQQSTLPLPVWDIDRWPTQVEFKAIDSWLYLRRTGMQVGWPIDETPTSIIPVIAAADPITDAVTAPQIAITTHANEYVAPLRKLIKSSGIYAVASMAPPLVALVLAPFLTRSLLPSDYGILTILITFISLMAGITQLGLGSAFFRAYNYDYTSERDRRNVLATTTTLLCLVSILMTIGIALLGPFLARFFFGRPSLGSLVAVAAGVVLLQNLTVPGFSWLRAESRAFLYAVLAISNSLIALIANLILVGVLHLGIVGALIATGSGYAGVMICTVPVIIYRTGIRIRADIARNLLTFGLPLVLNVVSYWVLQLSDRYLLSRFGSLEQTARYAVVYTLGSAMSVVIIGPFTLAWPTTMFAIAKRDDAAQVFRLIFRWFAMFLLFAAFGLSLVGKVLLNWLFPTAYHSASPIIPIISTSIIFYGIYYIFMVGANIKRKTWLAAVFTTIAALVNVLINLFLIPRYGAMGAAVSTLVAYIVLTLVAYIVNQRLYPVSFEIGRFIVALLAGIAFYAGSSYLAHSQGLYGEYGIYIGALVVYGGCLVGLARLPAMNHYIEEAKTRKHGEANRT
jgi:O-antigen/teichoic acid export membrane protein